MMREKDALRARIGRPGGLAVFVRKAWPLVEPRPLVWSWHLDVLCAHLEAVTRGECKNLIVNVPPGTSKSLIASVLWPAWWHTQDAGMRCITASYDPDLAARDSGRHLGLLRSAFVRKCWPKATVKGYDPAKSRFGNTAGGWRYSTSVRSAATGRHADVVIVDDPHKPLEVMQSPGSMQLVADWWGQTMASRTTDPENLRKVIIMQRLHENDLSGVCLAQGGYTHLCLPMEYEPERRCETPWGADQRAAAGELLAPQRFTEAACARLREDLGPYGWAGQYQQAPTSTDGGLFQAAWLDMAVRETMPTLTEHARWVCSWDLAFKGSEGADYVACVVAVREAGTYYLVDGLCERLDFQATVGAVRAMAERYPRAATVIEDKANGPAVENVLRSEVRSLELVNPQGGKLARAHAVVPLFAAGAVQVVRGGTWFSKWQSQMRRFPRASHDDMVDATTQALTKLRPSGGLDSLRKAYGRGSN